MEKMAVDIKTHLEQQNPPIRLSRWLVYLPPLLKQVRHRQVKVLRRIAVCSGSGLNLELGIRIENN